MSSECPPELKGKTHEEFVANLLNAYLHGQKQIKRLQEKCNEMLEEIRTLKGITIPQPKRSAVKLVYVAMPYRGPTPWKVEENVHAAKKVGAELAHLGVFPVIPQANTAHFDGIQSDRFWLDGTMELLRRCDAIFLGPGWRESEGAMAESAEADSLGIPAYVSIDKCGQELGLCLDSQS